MQTATYVVGTIGTRTNNPAAFTVAYPSVLKAGAGDLAILTVMYKPTTKGVGSVDTPSGWTAIGNTGHLGSGAANGLDTGDSIIYAFTKVLDGTESGSVTITVPEGTMGAAGAQINYVKGAGQGDWDVDFRFAGTDTAAASQSEALDSALDLATGDVVFMYHCTPTDIQASPFSNQAITATGITFGAFTELQDRADATGTDSTHMFGYWPVTAGSANVTPTVSFDIAGTNTNQLGPIAVVRARKPETTAADVMKVTSGTPVSQAALGGAVLTPTAPTHAADDVLIAFCYQNSTSGTIDLTNGTGWTDLYNADQGTAHSFRVLYKVATGSGTTIPGFSNNSTNAVMVACVLKLEGVDAADLIETAAAAENFAAGVAGNEHASISTARDNATVFFIPVFNNDLGYSLRETGWTGVTYYTTTDGADLNLQIFVKQLATAGSTGAITMVQESINTAAGLSFAINREAASEDYSWSGTAALSLGTTSGATHDHPTSGTAALSLSATGTGSTATSQSGTAALSLGTTSGASVAFSSSGTAALSLAATGDGSAQQGSNVEGSGTASLSLGTSGAATHNRSQSGSASISLVGTGAASIAVTAAGDETLDLTGTGSASITVSAPGSATLTLDETGDASIAVSGAGTDALVLAATGAGELGHWGNGTASPWAQTGGDTWTVPAVDGWPETRDDYWTQQDSEGVGWQ